jgi:hypothetical protein
MKNVEWSLRATTPLSTSPWPQGKCLLTYRWANASLTSSIRRRRNSMKMP